MAFEIVRAYTTTLSQLLTLSDVAIAEAAIRREGDDLPIPSFVPPGTSVLTACHFSERIIADVSDFTGEMIAVDVGNEAANSLRAMLESMRWRLEEVIAATWARGM